uniref:Uncharacterized protein n=1 Tax=Arundo donax TaxID=35708 RepID=A0A0A8Z879_ARUDO
MSTVRSRGRDHPTSPCVMCVLAGSMASGLVQGRFIGGLPSAG